MVGSVIAILWFLFLGATIQDVMDHKGKWLDKLNKLEEVSRDLEHDLEEEIDEGDMKELEKKMEDLEGEPAEKNNDGSAGDKEEVKKAEEELENLRREKEQDER
jgi:uncharacterized membrane protein YgaE (UPF0421/DUF939 family)